jgi:hypothetical protein
MGLLNVPDVIGRVELYFASLPRDARMAVLVVLGLALTLLAVPRFQERFPTALLFISLAVFFFWQAIAIFM